MNDQPSEHDELDANTDRSNRKTINLCGETCPETFVEAKLALEELEDGQRLNVMVDDSRSAKRVPRNMENHGQLHVRTDQQNGIWTLVFERKEDNDRERWVMLD